jgi:hypothetical protein
LVPGSKFHGGVRSPKQARGEDVTISLRTRPDLNAFMRVHAFRRDISLQEMYRLIATCWVRRATPIGNKDPKKNDPIYSYYSLGYHLPPAPSDEDYYPGLMASLRFLPEAEVDVDANEPPPATWTEQWPEE